MFSVLDRAYISARLRLIMFKESLQEMWEEERGSTSTVVIEIVMIGMILVLGFIFRKQIGNLFTSLWNSLVKFDDSADTPSIESMTNPFG